SAEIAQRAVANGYFATRSHACDPITCAAGVASIDIVLKEGLVERAATIGERMRERLNAMAGENEAIGDVRGRGVLYGGELVLDRKTKEPANAVGQEVVRICQENGLLVQSRGSHGRTNVIRLVPPMTCTDEQIDEGMEILRRAINSATQS